MILAILVAVIEWLSWRFIVIFNGLIGSLILVCVLRRVLMGLAMGFFVFISFFMGIIFIIGFVAILMDRII